MVFHNIKESIMLVYLTSLPKKLIKSIKTSILKLIIPYKIQKHVFNKNTLLLKNLKALIHALAHKN